MTSEHVKELVDVGSISGYRLPAGEEELRPEEDEAIVFRDYFVVGLVIPCHQFVMVVLDRYHIQLHDLTPTTFAHLSNFVWAMVSYDGDPDIEVFAHHFMLHNKTHRIKINGVTHDCIYASYSFAS